MSNSTETNGSPHPQLTAGSSSFNTNSNQEIVLTQFEIAQSWRVKINNVGFSHFSRKGYDWLLL